VTIGDGDAFVENGARLFETAQNAYWSGDAAQEMSILIAEDGSLRLCMSHSDWSLDSLRDHHGARVAYRVSRTDARVRVEGRAGSRTCLFEAAKPDGAARLLLANVRDYRSSEGRRPPMPPPRRYEMLECGQTGSGADLLF